MLRLTDCIEFSCITEVKRWHEVAFDSPVSIQSSAQKAVVFEVFKNASSSGGGLFAFGQSIKSKKARKTE
ncbi:MAG: hypothetical protein WCJ40_18770 [Planctomycetota bacterium]